MPILKGVLDVKNIGIFIWRGLCCIWVGIHWLYDWYWWHCGGLIALALVIPNIAVAVRRLHDVNKSGWWMLIAFIPIIGGLCCWCGIAQIPAEYQPVGAPARRLP